MMINLIHVEVNRASITCIKRDSIKTNASFFTSISNDDYNDLFSNHDIFTQVGVMRILALSLLLFDVCCYFVKGNVNGEESSLRKEKSFRSILSPCFPLPAKKSCYSRVGTRSEMKSVFSGLRRE